MSEKVSKTLIEMLNEITNIETEISKIEASIFIKKCNELIQEKIAYLYNLLQAEAKNYNRKSDNKFKYIEKVISTYREKLNIVYDESYLQYVNIQNELGEARLSQKAAIINYQKIVNDSEINSRKYDDLKSKIKNKNDIYEKIIEKCQNQYSLCVLNFENQINSSFYINSNLPIANNNVFCKIKNTIVNLFVGNKKYVKSLEEYERSINNIDTNKIVSNIRKQTIKFVTDILEMKDTSVDIDEAV